MATETLSPLDWSTKFKRGNTKNIIDRLSGFISLIQLMTRDADFFGPSKKRLCLTIKGQANGATSVISLSRLGFPKAIQRPISIVNIKALNGHGGGSFSHIFEKVLELMPPLTNDYSPAAVIGESSLLRVIATLMHSLPDFICLALTTAMSGGALSNFFRCVVTATRRGMTTSEITGSNLCILPANTSAEPSSWSAMTRRRNLLNSYEPVERFAGEYWYAHGINNAFIRKQLQESKQ